MVPRIPPQVPLLGPLKIGAGGVKKLDFFPRETQREPGPWAPGGPRYDFLKNIKYKVQHQGESNTSVQPCGPSRGHQGPPAGHRAGPSTGQRGGRKGQSFKLSVFERRCREDAHLVDDRPINQLVPRRRPRSRCSQGPLLLSGPWLLGDLALRGPWFSGTLGTQGPLAIRGPCLSGALGYQGPLALRGPWLSGALGSQGALVLRGPWFSGALGTQGPLAIRGP